MPASEQTVKRPTGMAGFSIVWAGQVVSILASNMTAFGLTIWIFQKTGSATLLGLMQVSFAIPFMLLSPLAGVWVDRYNRKLMMMVSDSAAGVGTLAILVLQATGHLEIWHLYVVMALIGLGNTFQWPAYSAAISTMVSKEQYGRANGMMALLDSAPSVFAPMLAGILLPFIGLTGILVIDVVTFLLALGLLGLVHIPQPVRTLEGEKARGNFIQEALFGFRYIFARPSLIGIQIIQLFGNFFIGTCMVVLAPMVLSRTGESTTSLAAVQSAWAIGAVVGGLVMTAWGGFKRRIHGVMLGWIIYGAFGAILLGFGRGLDVWIPAAAVGAFFVLPFMDAPNQSIWQAKVAPDVQGRVFTARRFISFLTTPITPVIGGMLADFVLEPAMRLNTSHLARVFGGWVGTGPGSGMSLIFIFCGVGSILVGIAGYLVPAIRNVETILPDHDQLPKAEESPAP